MTQRSILLLCWGDATGDRRAQNFSNYFKTRDWNVELIAIQPERPSGSRKFYEFYRRMLDAVREKRADVVLACDLYSLSAAAWMKRMGRARVLLYDARELYTELPSVARKPLSKLVWRTLERRGLKRTDLIIVTAPNDANAMCRVHNFLPRPVLVRNLPWREPELLPDRSLRDRLGIPGDAKVIVYLGGLQLGRGLEKLFDAMNPSPHEGEGQGRGHLLLIGDGTLRDRLEILAPRNVHFVGQLPPSDAMRYVMACDVGITLVEPLSKSYELALSSKLFEYMMCGVPVVSSRAEQVLDLFRDEEWITFVDENDAHSIREGIRIALAKSERPALRDRERLLALNKYHFERDAAMLMDVLNTFLG